MGVGRLWSVLAVLASWLGNGQPGEENPKYTLELEITGLAIMVQHTGAQRDQAQLLWLEGDWEGIPPHRPTLVVDLAQVESHHVDGLDNEVVRLGDGRTLLMLDLRKTEMKIDPGVAGQGVTLGIGEGPLPDPGDYAEKWKDLRFIAGMDLVTGSKAKPRCLHPRGYPGQVQGRILFDKGTFEAAMPHDPKYRKRWTFGPRKEQYVSDRLVWRYTSPNAKAVIQLLIQRGNHQAVINLRPKDVKDPLRVSASCYPALSRHQEAHVARHLEEPDKPLDWQDFPLFYEVLSPGTPRRERPRPLSEGIIRSITDAWCPSVRVDAQQD
jgi:hypothetical protein